MANRQYRFLLANAPGAEVSGIPQDIAETLIDNDTITIQGKDGAFDRTFNIIAIDTTDPTTTVVWLGIP